MPASALLARCLANVGGFDHNAQTLRTVTALERRYAAFDGLNLTWETLEGLLKHNGPLTDRDEHHRSGAIASTACRTRSGNTRACRSSILWGLCQCRAQVAALADDIAYNAHDIDDGLRAELFALDDLGEVPLAAALIGEIRRMHPRLDTGRTVHELVRRV